MKKLISLLLVTMMALSFMPALAEDMPEVLIDPATGKAYDLGGMNVQIALWWNDNGPDTSTAQGEATQEFRDWFQETYNFTIAPVNYSDWATQPEAFLNFATTGGEENIVFCCRPDSVAAPLASGLFYDLATLDCLDFSDEKWGLGVKSNMSKAGGIYGMFAGRPEPRAGCYFNKRLLEEAGIDPELPYDLQAANEWTWEAFEDMVVKCTRDVDNDGVNDAWGLCTFTGDFYEGAVASNMGTFFERDAEGKYVLTVNSDESLEALDWAVNMIAKYQMPQPEGDDNWEYFQTAFVNGQSAFLTAQRYYTDAGRPMRDMDDDYGFVFFPRGPKADKVQSLQSDNVYVIPSIYDADRAWKIAFAYNLYTEPTPGYEDTDDWKSAWIDNFRDDRAVDETLEMMVTPGYGVSWINDMIADRNSLLGDGFTWTFPGVTPAEAIEAKTPSWQGYLDVANGINPVE